jgi:hypothetical protein
VSVTSMDTLISLTLSDCWLHRDMQQFWAGGDDGCLNWHTFNTRLVPFSLPFSTDHFLFDTFLIQFCLTFHQGMNLSPYAIFMLFLHIS